MIDVSVIIPVYNTELYIEETIKSLADQEMKNYEIIVVDDGSTDKSIDIAESVLKAKEVPYRIIRQENKGLACARNTGIKAASGSYVCFVDSDDIIAKSHVSTMYSLAEKNNLDIVCCRFEVTTIENRYGIIEENGESRIINADEFAEMLINRNPTIHICCVLLKREFLLSNNLHFNEKLRYGEDANFFLELANTYGSVGMTNNSSYKYMNRPGSIMKTITLEQGEVFVEELKKTCDKLGNKADIAYGRWILGFLHVFARCADYKAYKEIAGKVDRRIINKTVKMSNQISVKGFGLLFCIHPSLVYIVAKMIG